MPGDQVKVSFEGMFRAVNKISGVFNPTVFKPTYYIGQTKFEGTLGQYQRMDNATVTVTIPADMTVPEGETDTCTLTNGYTYGSMYSAAQPLRLPVQHDRLRRGHQLQRRDGELLYEPLCGCYY